MVTSIERTVVVGGVDITGSIDPRKWLQNPPKGTELTVKLGGAYGTGYVYELKNTVASEHTGDDNPYYQGDNYGM